MIVRFVAVFFVIGLSALACAGEMKILSFYDVHHIDNELNVDGKLDEPEWESASSYKTYYEYFKSNPDAGKLDTEFKMLYSAKGIYLAVINHEKNMAALRANFTAKDAESLWQDDCNEIFFDSFGNGVGYTKYTVNSIGTVGDMKRIDAAVTLNEWSGSAWRSAVCRNKTSWVVEAFFPWDDLGNAARAGSIWKFCNVRYAYTSGRFIGVTSSPGGNYMNTEDFGYLYFSGKTPLSIEKTGEVLSRQISPSWILFKGDHLIICKEKSEFKVDTVSGYLGKEKTKIMEQLKITDGMLGSLEKSGETAEISKSLESIKFELEKNDPEKSQNNQCVMKKMIRAGNIVNDLYWRVKTMKLLAEKI